MLRRALIQRECANRAENAAEPLAKRLCAPKRPSLANYSTESRISERLFDRVCEGRLPVTEAHAFAADVVSDFGSGKQNLVDGWASLGNSGQHKGNCHRDLRRWAKTFGIDLEIAIVKTIVKNLRKHGTIEQDHAVLYPHEVFAATWEAGMDACRYIFLSPEGVEDVIVHTAPTRPPLCQLIVNGGVGPKVHI